jgi:hypothetical protein
MAMITMTAVRNFLRILLSLFSLEIPFPDTLMAVSVVVTEHGDDGARAIACDDVLDCATATVDDDFHRAASAADGRRFIS